jgi:hypothetical protein
MSGGLRSPKCSLNASTDALAEAEADMAAMGRQARVATKNCLTMMMFVLNGSSSKSEQKWCEILMERLDAWLGEADRV